MKLKYVIDDMNEFAIFSCFVSHDDVAGQFKHTEIVSAGFIEIFNNEVTCFGKSISLNMQSRGHFDSVIIAAALDLKSKD